MKQAFTRALETLAHSFDTRLIAERELEQARLLSDSVALYSLYAPLPKRRKGIAPTSSRLYF